MVFGNAPALEPVPEPTPEPTSEPSTSWWSYILGGAGIGGLITVVVMVSSKGIAKAAIDIRFDLVVTIIV
eukprot:TRINITY_DN13907_c0_g1_i1.p1 TRINITY_DN13907_c0_g1~~TRINITY_DN13907_c0_g1_i1.p1  ORF type:complete len:70 (-),score=11.05 TRINITY_DN13907_c0_g1_i1:138-347(-)